MYNDNIYATHFSSCTVLDTSHWFMSKWDKLMSTAMRHVMLKVLGRSTVRIGIEIEIIVNLCSYKYLSQFSLYSVINNVQKRFPFIPASCMPTFLSRLRPHMRGLCTRPSTGLDSMNSMGKSRILSPLLWLRLDFSSAVQQSSSPF